MAFRQDKDRRKDYTKTGVLSIEKKPLCGGFFGGELDRRGSTCYFGTRSKRVIPSATRKKREFGVAATLSAHLFSLENFVSLHKVGIGMMDNLFGRIWILIASSIREVIIPLFCEKSKVGGRRIRCVPISS